MRLRELPMPQDKFQLIYELEKEIDQRLRKGAYVTNEADQITALNLDNLKLTEFPQAVFKFRSLYALSLANNQLNSLPSDIQDLRHLVRINLNGNQLRSLPSSIGELTDLRILNLNRNKLEHLPETIADLKKLRELHLAENGLTQLPYRLSELKSLQIMDLGENQISKLPAEFRELEIPFKWTYDFQDYGIYLENNPLIMPPASVVKEEDQNEIRFHLENAELSAVVNKELKCCIIGPAGSGKTSFRNYLTDKPFEMLPPSTAGIDFDRVKLVKEESEVDLKIWDFSGAAGNLSWQTCFFTGRTIYFLVIEPEQYQNLNVWLDRFNIIPGAMRLFIVINKTDLSPLFDVDREHLSKKYPFISGIYAVSLMQNTGLEPIMPAIFRNIQTFDMYKLNIPVKWIKLIQQVKQAEEPVFSLESLSPLFLSFGFNKPEDQETLLALMEDLGIVSHLKEEPEMLALNEWLIQALTLLYNSEPVRARDGILTGEELEILLDGLLDEQHHREFLIRYLLEKKLAWRHENFDFYLPDCFRKDEPEFDFDFEKATKLVVPYKSLLPELITQMLTHLLPQMKDKLVWRNGIVTAQPENETITVYTFDLKANKVLIAIAGEKIEATFSAVRQFFVTFNTLFEGLLRRKAEDIGEHELVLDFDELISHRQLKFSELTSAKMRQLQHEAERAERIANEEKTPARKESPAPRWTKHETEPPKRDKKNDLPDTQKASSIVKLLIGAAVIIWALIFLSELLR
jgi:internalin A